MAYLPKIDFSESKSLTVRFLKHEASTKSLTRSGADLLPDQTNDLGDFSIMTPYTQYVADHIHRISGVHAGHPERILDSKWRIASCLGLFKDLDPTGKLTTQQVEVIDIYITKFLSTSVGQEAITHYQRRKHEIQG